MLLTILRIAQLATVSLVAACGDQSMKGPEVELPVALGEKILADHKRLTFCMRQQFGLKDDLAPFVRVQTVDLNGDGNPEFLVTNRTHHNCLCGNRTCAGWLYRNAGGHYENLLERESSGQLRLGSVVTNGYVDLIEQSDGRFRVHLSFDARRYGRAICERKGDFELRWTKTSCP